MADPQAVAEKIAAKAAATLNPLEQEMNLMRWPNEFRTIMWQAVADHAALLAAETAQK